MDSVLPSPNKSRIGFHYYPDTVHYRETDLAAWLPELKAMATGWLTLNAPLNRAIPEVFLRQLLAEHIEPVLHFHFQPTEPPEIEEFSLLCRTYARWGARYVVLFDRPNLLKYWPASVWAQSSLVERFIDVFQPLALAAARNGMIPVFPPLEPGGDYWDTAFLRTAFESLLRRNQSMLLDRLAISGYARSNGHPLSWGCGGPARWPNAQPYNTPAGSEDQRGFRIFDWYLALSEAVFGAPRPMLLFGIDHSLDQPGTSETLAPDLHTTQNLLIARLLKGEKVENDPIPAQVLAGNFWLLTSTKDDPAASAAWFQADGSPLPAVGALRQWAASHGWCQPATDKMLRPLPASPAHSQPITHYLLLPNIEWAASARYLDLIRPFIDQHRPTIGFSPAEAVHAQKVTVMGTPEQIPDSILEALTTAGCMVEDMRGDGTTIAS